MRPQMPLLQPNTAIGDISGLTPDARWAKEENTIKLVLGSTLPDMASNRIKTTVNICDTWEILKWVYEERSKALVMDIIWKFQNKCCDEDKSIRSHLNTLLTSTNSSCHWQGSNGRGLHGHAPHLASDLIRQRSLIHQRKRTP